MSENPSASEVTLELLKRLRKEAKFTQAQLAEKLGISQAVLSRYESGEIPIPLEIAVKLIDELGLGYRMMVGEPNRDFGPLDSRDPYRDYTARIRLLGDFIRIEAPESDPADLHAPANLDVLVRNLLLLPRLVIAGRSDAGKSHVANCLLGTDILPTGYQPLTRIPIALVHKSYRPAFVKDDCAMMRGAFDLGIMLDEPKFSEYCVLSGDTTLLGTQAIHTDVDSEGSADWAIVFLDVEILRACVMVDTPGFSASETDTDRAAQACRGAEILLYCSPVVNCLNPDDFIRINHLLRTLPSPELLDPSFPALGNFLFITTHAGPQITEEKLHKAQHQVSARFMEHFGEDIRKRNPEHPVTREDVMSRFVTFWSELESRYRVMREKVQRLLHEDFPRYRMMLANREISDFRERATAANKSKIDEWQKFLSRWEDAKRQVHELETKEPERLQWASERKQAIEDAVRLHERDSLTDFRHFYKKRINPERVEKTIRKHFSKQEDAQNEIAALLIKRLQDHVGNDLDEHSKQVAEQITQFLKDFTGKGRIHIDSQISGDFTPGFDAIASFAGGLAGLATFGALAAWAATLGNLGGYIIVAQAVGLLSAIGLPTGGVAAVVTAISALGGPVVLALAFAVIAAISAFFWFSKSWQLKMAEKICEEFERQEVYEKIKYPIKRYWDNTLIAFRQATDAVELSWQVYLLDLKGIVESDSKNKIQQRIDALERRNDFFARLPWVPIK